jgi:Flp pilus assembly secretin CpaC
VVKGNPGGALPSGYLGPLAGGVALVLLPKIERAMIRPANFTRGHQEKAVMLLRIVILGAMLLAMQNARAEETQSDQQLLKQKLAELDELQREVQRLREVTGTEQQIVVKVQMLEIDLSKLRNRGLDTDWFSDGYVKPNQLQQLLEATGQSAHVTANESADEAKSNENLRFVQWLKQKNIAKVLADPTIVATSGKPASMFVGGQFPMPLGKGSDAAVNFRQFGTQLHLHAQAMGDNRVRLELDASVSSIDQGHAIEINGVNVPGLKLCECDTGCELSFGETVVITGHVEKRVEAIQGQNGEVKEVTVDVGYMVVVTPEIAQPIEGSVAGAKRARETRLK